MALLERQSTCAGNTDRDQGLRKKKKVKKGQKIMAEHKPQNKILKKCSKTLWSIFS